MIYRPKNTTKYPAPRPSQLQKCLQQNTLNSLIKNAHIKDSKKVCLQEIQNQSHTTNNQKQNFYLGQQNPSFSAIKCSQPQNKQILNRNRLLVQKAENINKIHEQISSLLKYVKNDESKTPLKKSSYFQNKNKYTESFVQNFENNRNSQTIVSQVQKKYTKSKEESQYKSQFERSSSNLISRNGENNKSQNKLSKITKNRNGNAKKHGKLICRQKDVETENDDSLELESSPKYAQKFVKQISHEGLKLKSNKNKNHEINMVDYEYQIAKVRERIQSSQQILQKIQCKHTRHDTPINRLKLSNPLQGQSQEQSCLQKNIYDSLQNNKQFKIKLISCDTQSEQQKPLMYKSIAIKFLSQIGLDQKLEQAKVMFHRSKDQNKWTKLKFCLQDFGIKYSQSQLEQELEIFDDRSYKYSKATTNYIQKLAQIFVECEQFWQQKIYHFFPKSQISKGSFNPKCLDPNNKGYISINDMINFVHSHTKVTFKEQQIFCLFRRICAFGSNAKGIEYDSLVEVLTNI